ncbi:hypothetical protein PG993_000476 [Apiospora rasikravindrae]|uniref:Secreted protein n=1 Tax=Apiospora rasikravindrae TaxID=990691 RepID=A0ABR1UBH3_9PEZI
MSWAFLIRCEIAFSTSMMCHLDEEQRVRLSWKQKGAKNAAYQNATFGYAVIAMPFSKVKLWRFPSKISPSFLPLTTSG